jgi:hypothetical protein
MSQPVSTLELALRFRRDADATCLPEYADLMRRVADDLEAFARLRNAAPLQREHKPG